MRLHYKARKNEAIQYVDVTSLYPDICKYFKFPVVRLIIHVGHACKDKEAWRRVYGLIKYSIVRPERLYHPLLAFTCNYELIFCHVERASSPYPVRNVRILEMRIVPTPVGG